MALPSHSLLFFIFRWYFVIYIRVKSFIASAIVLGFVAAIATVFFVFQGKKNTVVAADAAIAIIIAIVLAVTIATARLAGLKVQPCHSRKAGRVESSTLPNAG